MQGLATRRALTASCSVSAACFFLEKLAVLGTFFGYELPKMLGLSAVLTHAHGLTVEWDNSLFAD